MRLQPFLDRRIEKDLFTPYTIESSGNKATAIASQNEHLYMYTTGSTADLCSTINETITTADGKETKRVFSKCQRGCLMDLGTLSAGDRLELTSSEGSISEVSLNAYQLDEDVMAKALDILGRQKLEVKEAGTDYLKGTVNVTEAGRLFMSIPDEKNWTLYVDGVKTDIIEFKGAFISVDLAKGTHDIYLKFKPIGQNIGILISLIAVLIFTAVCLIPSFIVKPNDSITARRQ